jgi:hypothetical protein
MYVWKHKRTGCYWSGDLQDWADIHRATYFTAVEAEKIVPEEDEELVQLWDVPEIRHARLIAECEAAGVFAMGKGEMLEAVGESMDLDAEQVCLIIDTAQDMYAASVEKIPGRKLKPPAPPSGKYRFRVHFRHEVVEKCVSEIVTDFPLHELYDQNDLSEADWFDTVNAQDEFGNYVKYSEVQERDLTGLEMLSPEQKTILEPEDPDVE